jgi:hypothetical protein
VCTISSRTKIESKPKFSQCIVSSRTRVSHQEHGFCIKNTGFASRTRVSHQEHGFRIKNTGFASRTRVSHQEHRFRIKNTGFTSRTRVSHQEQVCLRYLCNSGCVPKAWFTRTYKKWIRFFAAVRFFWPMLWKNSDGKIGKFLSVHPIRGGQA